MAIKIYDVRSVKGDSAFLLDDGKTTVLHDVGFGFSGHGVAEKIKAVLGDRPLDFIFLSHSHYDHALGCAAVLRHYPNATVVAGEYAAGIFKRDGAKRVMRELDSKHAEKCGVTDYEFLGDELRVDIPVNEGDTVKAGELSFRVLALPGHTRCSVGFIEEKEGLLLSSETLGVYDGDQTIVPSYLVSYADSIASIEKVESLPIKRMIAPHYGPLDEEKTRFFLTHMKEAAKKTAADIKAALSAGKTVEEITEDFKAEYWHGYIKEVYPEDAINLNTSIMINLINKELLGAQ